MTTIPLDRIRQIEARRDELQAAMARADLPAEQFVKLSKDYAELEPVAEAAGAVRRLRREVEDLDAMVAGEADAELRAMAGEELPALRETLAGRGAPPRARAPAQGRRRRAPPPSSRSAPAPAATRRRCSRATSSACTSAMPTRAAGGPS